jgi:hypothetical protein
MICRSKSLRIGGEFEFNAKEYGGKAGIDLSARFANRNCLWTDTGRSALLIAASAILHCGGKPRAWVPAFSCESIAQPFRQAGFDIQYYPVGTGLAGENVPLPQPDTGETLLFIHYFGHRNSRMSLAAQGYRAAGVWIIEDCVQGGLIRDLGSGGDFAVTSFRKLLPVMEGAAVLSRKPVDLPAIGLDLAQSDESFVCAKLMGKILRGSDADAQDFLPLLESSELRLQGRVIPRHMSWLSTWMMARLDWADVIDRRRANWLSLADEILKAKLADQVRPLFTTLGDEDVPLGMPVRIAHGKRDALRAHLAARQIYCPIHWHLDHLPKDEPFTNERELASSVLTLPVDQRMSAAHVTRLAQELTSYFTKSTAVITGQ